MFADRKLLLQAAKDGVPIFLGYFPTGFTFGLLLASVGYSPWLAPVMSIFIYAGAAQYLAVGLLQGGVSILQMGLLTFLINSKHLFYGLSLLEDYKGAGWRKPYLIFSLTDEVYATLTGNSRRYEGEERKKYCLYISLLCHMVWLLSSILGAVAGAVIKFDASGMDFAMTAMFIVIIIGQIKTFKTKIPFAVGAASAIFAMLVFGKGNMLLFGSLLSLLLLILLRKRVSADDNGN